MISCEIGRGSSAATYNITFNMEHLCVYSYTSLFATSMLIVIFSGVYFGMIAAHIRHSLSKCSSVGVDVVSGPPRASQLPQS